MTELELIQLAMEVQQRAYAPYSKFKVGAALLASSGNVFVGCNVENASYGLAICAERGAISTAVANGETQFDKIAVVASPLATPCGACRQVLFQFGPDLEVICASEQLPKEFRSYRINELLPHGFSLS